MASLTLTTIVVVFIFTFASFHLPISGRHLSTPQVTRFNDIQRNSPYHPDMDIYYIYPVGYLTKPGVFTGASAQMSLWPIPDVKPNSTSENEIDVGNESQLRFVRAGFHVYPELYKDNDLHFFTYWSILAGRDSKDCYNTQCPGFVVADEATLRPGQAMAPPLSTYNGDDISIIITIKQDEETKDWLLSSTSQGKTTLVGRWPKTLFTSDSASYVLFGGTTSFNSSEPSPPMGSGHFANEGEKKAAYFKQITLFDKNGKGYVPSSKDMSRHQSTNGCYTVSPILEETPDHGSMFYFGGPSGCKTDK